jgi:hypothetical protein
MSETDPSSSPLNSGGPKDPARNGAALRADAAVSPPISPSAPEKKPRRRRWRWVAGLLGALLLLAAIAVVMAPTLAGMDWVRAIVIEQINKGLNGRVEVAGYSVSWNGGVKASGIRVYDAQSALIAEVGSISTQLSLLDAIRGRFNFGQTTIAGVGFTFKQYPDGSTNFDRLLKRTQSPSPSPGPTAPEAARPSEPMKLPPLSMHLRLVGWHGVVERDSPIAGKSQVIDFDGIDADVNIADINSPIDHTLKIVARMNNGPAQGTFTEKGTLAVVQNNRVSPSTAAIKETLSMENFDLAGAQPFLPASVRQLAGVANGSIDLDIASGKSGTVGATLDIQKPAVALAAFAGDESLPLDRFGLSFPQPTTIDLTGGPDHWADWVLKVGDGRTQQITLFAEKDGTKLLDLTVAANVTPGQILGLAANRRPTGAGGAGRLEVIAHADPGKLFQLMPKTLALKNGVELTSAQVQYTASADFTATSALLNQALDSSEIKGRDTVEKRDITVQPFHLSFKGTTFGGGWQMPDLRDLGLTIHHGPGINGDFQGAALTSVNGALDLKPREILAELGQFIDLGNRTAEGDVTVTARAQGDLPGSTSADSSKPAVNTFQLQLAAHDLKLAGLAAANPGAILAQKFVGVDISGEVDRNRGSGQVEALRGLRLLARAGDEAQPNVVADLKAALVAFQDSLFTDPTTGKSSTIRSATIPELKAEKLGVVDLKLAQADFGVFLPFLKDIRIDHGSLSLVGTSGSYDGAAGILDFGLFPRIDELTAVRLVPSPTISPAITPSTPRAPTPIVSGYSLAAAIGGKLSSGRDSSRLTLSNVSVTDSPQWLNIAKAGNGPVEIAFGPDGTLAAHGGIKLEMELAPLNDMASALTVPPIQAAVAGTPGPAPAPLKLTSGRLEGTITLADTPTGAIGVAVDLNASSLTVTGDGPGVNNESVGIVLRGSAAGDLSQLAVTQLDATGSVVTAHVPKASVWLKTGAGKDQRSIGQLQMLRELSAVVNVPDAGKLQAMVDAFSPAEPAAPAAQPSSAAPATAPVHARFTTGSVAINLDVANKDNQLTFTPDIQGKGLAFMAGPVKHKLGDIAFKTKVIVIAVPTAAGEGIDGQTPPILQQISQLLIPELLATGAGGTVALSGQPIIINDPAYLAGAFATSTGQNSGPTTVPAGKAPSINAAVSIAGDLPTLTNLLDAIAGRPPAPGYLGTYSFQQTLVTRNGTIKADGKGSIQDLIVLDTDHKTQTFTEKNLAVEDGLSLDGAHGPAVLSIGKLRLYMQSSGALDVSVAGAVHDLSGRRQMDHVVADLTYDGEKLTPVLRSLLAPRPTPTDPHPLDRFKDLRMAGRKTERFAIWGNYPAGIPFEQAVASLSASGALAIDSLDTMGLDIQNLQLPVWMDHGVVKLALAPGSAPATAPTTGPGAATTAACNGGTINLSGMTLDLTAPSPLLSIPPETKVLDNVALNKVLATTANTYLPVFDDTDATSGNLTLTVHRCDRLPIEQLTTETSAQSAGMDFTTAFTNVQLGGPLVDAIEKVGAKDIRANLRGDIPDARFQLGGGRLVVQNFNLLGGRGKLPVLKLTGKVGLSRDGLMSLIASVPPELLSRLIPDKKLLEYFPEKLDFPINGTKSAPRPSIDKSVQKALGQAGQKALLRAFGGDKHPTSRPEGASPDPGSP